MHDIIHTDPFLSTMVPIRVNRKEQSMIIAGVTNFTKTRKVSVNIFPTVSKKTDSKIVQMNVLDLQLHSLWVRIVMV